MGVDAVKFALNQVAAINFFNKEFPKSEYQIFYNWNPFNLKYNGFSLLKKEVVSYNPFSDEIGTDEALRKTLKKNFPDLKFEEQMNGKRNYDKEFLLQFLIKMGYDHPADKLCKELMNPFTGERLEIMYNELEKPIGLKKENGEILPINK